MKLHNKPGATVSTVSTGDTKLPCESKAKVVGADHYDEGPTRAAPTPNGKPLAARELRGFAVIDLGSSSAKMLVLRRAEGTVLDVKVQTELGLGTSPGQPLTPQGKAKALEAIAGFVKKAEQLGIPAGEVNLMATAAVRNASDGAAFAEQIRQDFKLESVRVLAGEQEAEMGYLGAIAAFTGSADRGPEKFAALDLGGSSFQLAVGTDTQMERGGSTQVGSNVIQSELLPVGLIAETDFAKADAELRLVGGAHEAKLPLEPALLSGRQVVATGGVSKFLRRHFGKDVIERGEIDALRRRIGALEVAVRGPFLQQGKDAQTLAALGIDTETGATGYGKKLPASMTLLLRIMDGIGIDELHVSETDNRHALVAKVRRELSAGQDLLSRTNAI